MLKGTSWRQIEPEMISDNVFKLIGKDWMLITAGSPDAFNTMTASWGAMGILWGRRVALVVVRPQRYTFEFMERSATFSLSFFDESYRSVLNFCGTHSGRDVDKVAATGLTPLTADDGTIYFAEARLVLVCRKLYAQDLDSEAFIDKAILPEAYPAQDYHRMYVGEIRQVLSRE